jgi:hypothetical protein
MQHFYGNEQVRFSLFFLFFLFSHRTEADDDHLTTQERYRTGNENGAFAFVLNKTISSEIDAATARETYTFAFAEAVRFVFAPRLSCRIVLTL